MAKTEKRTTKKTHFGEQTVLLAEKQGLVNDVFHSVARRYDLMNDLMSGGLHRAWKDALVTAINPPKSERPFRLIDVAGGTRDVAFRTAAPGGGAAPPRGSGSATSPPTCAGWAASAPPSAGSTPRSPSSRATPRRCRF